jgi:host factor-I protein
MARASVNLQDSFLNQVRKENSEVKIVLTDGSSLTGVVRGFDNFTVILNSKESQHLIYKHAISQLITKRDARRVQQPSSEEARAKRPQGFNTLDLSQIKVGEAK